MSTIPISQIVTMQPGVVSGGGAASLLTGLVLTQDASVPPGQFLDFYDATDVSNWFGATSNAATLANAYFPGTINGGQLPYDLKFAFYATAAQPAGVFGAQLGTMTLAQLQALSGTLIVTTAALHTSSSINLSSATSFANAASTMTAAFTSPDFAITYDAQRGRFLLMTTLTGTTAACSAVTGTLATGVGLSATAGAYNQAAGIAADASEVTALNRIINQTTNWATFTTDYAIATVAERMSIAQWNSGQNSQYLYVSWDLDAIDTQTGNTSNFGYEVFAQPYQGTLPVYGTIGAAGAAMAWAASINFNVPNGRTTLAFQQSTAGVSASVSDLATANALLSNNYTYIGNYANAANTWTIFYNGKVSGEFLWADTYVNQIWLNRSLQQAFFEAMLAYNSLPYNQDGYTNLYRAGVDVINSGVTAGVIRAGVTLSNSQQQLINTQAGRTISDVVQTRGWYLLIGDPSNPAQSRQNRTTPVAQLWYCDGGSIQQLTVQSRAVI
jgi:hypothetical protein